MFPGRGNAGRCAVTQYMGEGPRGSNGTCSTLPDFSHSLRSPQSNWTPQVLNPEWVDGLVHALRLGVSPAAAPTLRGVFNQRFEALCPCAGALGCAVCFAPLIPLYLCVNVGPREGTATHCTAYPDLCHSESGSLGSSMLECGAAGLTACPGSTTLRQSGAT